ncbi:MAG: serpin family protein [Planctomycetota bacterium]
MSCIKPLPIAYGLVLWCGCCPPQNHENGLPEIAVEDVVLEDRLAAAQGISDFGGRLLALLLEEEPDENLLISPSCLYSALAMLSAGARGETLDQLAETLAFRLDPKEQHAANGALEVGLREAATSGPFTLELANRLWGQSSFALDPACVDLMKRAYGAPLAPLDFGADPERARGEINSWVSDRTRGKIEDLMPPGSINALTRLVITSAVYFKGVWETPFPESATRPGEFTRRDGSRVEADFMRMREDLRFADLGDGLALELPYQGGQISMLLVLPDDLEKWASGLTAERLEQVAGEVETVKVDVVLPRFRFSSDFSLRPQLIALGMEDAFDPARADFSGLSDSPDLYVQAVMHKTFIEVNEEGTEAAGATGISLGLTAEMGRPVTFHADRPFLFLIRHVTTGALLFLGRVADPAPGS